MATYKSLHDFITNVTGPVKFNLTLMLQEAENDFIEKTKCTMKPHTIITEAENNGELSDVYDLPADFVDNFRVEFDGRLIEPLGIDAPFVVHDSSDTLRSGWVSNYTIENQQIRLINKPNSHGYLYLWYCFYNLVTTGTSPIIPAIEHRKLPDQVIQRIAEIMGLDKIAITHEGRWEKNCTKARLKYINQRYNQKMIIDVNDINSDPGIQSLLNEVTE